jgi:hypothetical protein
MVHIVTSKIWEKFQLLLFFFIGDILLLIFAQEELRRIASIRICYKSGFLCPPIRE